MVDIARDPRWGRMMEGAGEDPFLGSAMAAAQIRGFQGTAPGDPQGMIPADSIMACVKHFAGYGAALGGRDYSESNISDEQLWKRLSPTLPRRHRGRLGLTHVRLHGPQRSPRLRQSLAPA